MSRTTQRRSSVRPPWGTWGGVCQKSPAFTGCSTPSWIRIHPPSRHTPHCSFGCECTGDSDHGSTSTTESIRCVPGKIRARIPGASARGMPPSRRVWHRSPPIARSSPGRTSPAARYQRALRLLSAVRLLLLEIVVDLRPIEALLIHTPHRQIAVQDPNRGVPAERVDDSHLVLLETHAVGHAVARQEGPVDGPVFPRGHAHTGREALGVAGIDDIPPEQIDLRGTVRRVEVRPIILVAGGQAQVQGLRHRKERSEVPGHDGLDTAVGAAEHAVLPLCPLAVEMDSLHDIPLHVAPIAIPGGGAGDPGHAAPGNRAVTGGRVDRPASRPVDVIEDAWRSGRRGERCGAALGNGVADVVDAGPYPVD